MEHFSDNDIFKMIRTGRAPEETRAVRFLLRQHRSAVVGYVTQNSGTREDGEEVLDDAIVFVCGNIRNGTYSPQPGVKLGTYLFQVARNVWLKTLRKRKRRLGTEDNPGEERSQDPTAEELLIALENQERFRQIWQMISEKEQEILTDAANDMDYDTIAVNYRLKNAANAKQRKYMIAKKLRELIKKYGGIF